MTDDAPPENEIMAAARAARASKAAVEARADPARWRAWQLATIGVGIGSAAVAAAMIYANRGKKDGSSH